MIKDAFDAAANFVNALAAAPSAVWFLIFILAIIGLIVGLYRARVKIVLLREQIDLRKVEGHNDDTKTRAQFQSQLFNHLSDIEANNVLIKTALDKLGELRDVFLSHADATDSRWPAIAALLADIQRRMAGNDSRTRDLLMHQITELRRQVTSKDEIIAGLEERIRILTTKE